MDAAATRRPRRQRVGEPVFVDASGGATNMGRLQGPAGIAHAITPDHAHGYLRHCGYPAR